MIPQLFANKTPRGCIRAWVCGCSTGEEAYSVAMLLQEYADSFEDGSVDFKVFATDIDKDAIEVASHGAYPVSIAADLSPERVERFFTRTGDLYQVNRQLREKVLFATHNLAKDPPFTKVDLISCRNLLIYLQPVLQRRILSLFHFALLPSAYRIREPTFRRRNRF